MIFILSKIKGQISFEKSFKDYTDKLKDGHYQINFETLKRTTQQNRYYWAYLRIISQETGDNENDLHEYFKRKFLPPRFVIVLGQEVKLPATTTKLSKPEFSKYIEEIEILTGIPAPETN